jgi:hypothetical protein
MKNIYNPYEKAPLTKEVFNHKCKKSYLNKIKKELSVFRVDLGFIYKYVPFLIDSYIEHELNKNIPPQQ